MEKKFVREHAYNAIGDDLLRCLKCNGYFPWIRKMSMISSGSDPNFCPHCGVKFSK